jgi:hypothetical protein
VYFVQVGDTVKIGTSAWVEDRRRQLGRQTGAEARLLGVIPNHDRIPLYALEYRIQAMFGHLRIRPRGEWFAASDELLRWISTACTEFSTGFSTGAVEIRTTR